MKLGVHHQLGVIGLILWHSAYAMAYFSLDKTRVVIQENQPRQPLVIHNTAAAPAVLCAFVDHGQPDNYCFQHQGVNEYFSVVPSVFKIPAHQSQLTYVLPKKKGLAKDRETVFWLNITDYLSPQQKEKHVLQQRIKVFYRPVDIIGLDPKKTLTQLAWTRQTVGNNSNITKVTIQNPTPFYASFARLTLTVEGKSYLYPEDKMVMVAPFSQESITFPASGDRVTLRYELIDDFGKIYPQTITLP